RCLQRFRIDQAFLARRIAGERARGRAGQRADGVGGGRRGIGRTVGVACRVVRGGLGRGLRLSLGGSRCRRDRARVGLRLRVVLLRPGARRVAVRRLARMSRRRSGRRARAALAAARALRRGRGRRGVMHARRLGRRCRRRTALLLARALRSRAVLLIDALLQGLRERHHVDRGARGRAGRAIATEQRTDLRADL
ncbi:hypothetical protein F3J20_30975, partial [Paraburkholderia sp. Cy-641]|nr:hypothetical protein [Paraburkholderia sp. Cy-641]